MSTTVTPEQVESRVLDALVTFGADASVVSRDATWEQLEVDSLDLVELAQVVEDEYGVEITSQDMQSLPTVGSVIDLVVERAA
ncbi:MAG TPA: phosphopantetheine-binding protein [Solirubrobacteraceae bacterium]|jgi:acyl carrier protein|nr:phosphopantetheine-binding protein [Solirubrobacteraceae bacterium]